MTVYDLYLESGPKRKTTIVHVPQLTGCTWNAPTTDEAVGRAAEEIAAFLRFLADSGERARPEAPVTTRIAHHEITAGFLSIAFFAPDARPLPQPEAERLMRRLAAMHAELRRTVAPLSRRQLEAKPARGRPIRQILSHICVEGAYLRGVSGSSRIQREVDEGKRDAFDALDELHELEIQRLREMPADERAIIIQRPSSKWSARYAVRRMLEHCWEHLREIQARLDNGAGNAPASGARMRHQRNQGGTAMGDKSPKNTQKSNKQKAQKKAGAKAGKK